MEDLTQHPRYRDAVRHARNVRGFYTHALVYVLVNALLIGINMATSRGHLWFGWATLGWGIGLAAHGLSVFAFRGWLGPDWEERKVRQYLERRP